ncbi:MAG: hypothetical protein MZV65_53850 [Chromatiales bacterium]|nr:hypothetical protein [Chromatiales bacterium]
MTGEWRLKQQVERPFQFLGDQPDQIRIACQTTIACQQIRRQGLGLDNEQAIEGVAMMPGQHRDGLTMPGNDGQLDKTGLFRQFQDVLRIEVEIGTSKRIFDGDFPNTGGAEEDSVGRIA